MPFVLTDVHTHTYTEAGQQASAAADEADLKSLFFLFLKTETSSIYLYQFHARMEEIYA